MTDHPEINPDAHPGEIEIEFQHDYQHTMALSEDHLNEALAFELPANVTGVSGGQSYA